MKKVFFAMAFAGLALSMSAQRASDAAFAANDLKDYNRLGISYNNEHYSFNKAAEDDVDGLGLNGFGIDYIHGFHITENLPLFIETGLNFNFNSKKVYEEGGEYWEKETLKT